MLCANADELPTHLYCFTLQFVTQSTRNQPSTPSQTRSKAEPAARGSNFSHTAPQLCQGDAQLQLCTLIKRTISEHLTQPREPTEVALLPPQIWSPDTAVPMSLRWERMQTAPTSMTETLH